MLPAMNGSYYFQELYSENHIDIFTIVAGWLSPVALLINIFGLYVIVFASGTYLKVLKPHLIMHQITLIIFDFIILDIAKAVMLFPVTAGYTNGFARSWSPHSILVLLCFGVAFWALTCTTSLQVLLFKHQNLWPPGSRWKLSLRGRIIFCGYFHFLSSVTITLPIYFNGVNFDDNKRKLVTNGLQFMSHILEQPYVVVIDDDSPWFMVLTVTVTHILLTFILTVIVGSISTYHGLRQQRKGLSQKTYKMQMKYLVILLIQLVAPLFFSFVPCLFCIGALLCRIWVPVSFNLVLFNLSGTHGMVATIFCVSLNRCYRNELLRIIFYPMHIFNVTVSKRTSQTTEVEVLPDITSGIPRQSMYFFPTTNVIPREKRTTQVISVC